MHTFDTGEPVIATAQGPWYRELKSYHWFVLVVAALGWLFDTMDQQLFNLARQPAMLDLVPNVTPERSAYYGGLATMIFLLGWATGGLAFGILGDRIGRAKTMLWTIVIYSLCTGLSALSVGFWDFAFYRFLTGLGVGGEFAVGVTLVAETMPPRARPFALGLLQALSAIGNITAAVISIVLSRMEEAGSVADGWRVMFVIGTLPALLAVLIRRRLKEPEQWQAVQQKKQELALQSGAAGQTVKTFKPGSYGELFGVPRWRHHAIVGLVLALSGVVGLWGIGFFSIDLIRLVVRKPLEAKARADGEADKDRKFLQLAIMYPSEFAKLKPIPAAQILSPDSKTRDAEAVYAGLSTLVKGQKPVTVDSVLDQIGQQRSQTADERARRLAYLQDDAKSNGSGELKEHEDRILKRNKQITGRLNLWAGVASVTLNIGAFFGIYAFSYITHLAGRRIAFGISFFAALLSTAFVFWTFNTVSDIFWKIPLMGFCQLSLFGGYAIYFPELFPTHLRSTGTSFCYNVGRYVAAPGPFVLGYLTSVVFATKPEPMRYAGVAMCGIFLLGLLALPFAPETKDKPLPT